MNRTLKNAVVGGLALAGVALATTATRAMPIQNPGLGAAEPANVQTIWWRGGHGWRGYGWRGYGWRGYGARGYGWGGPIWYGPRWGWRRPYGWRGYGWRGW